MEIIADGRTGNRIIPSIVYFKNKKEYFIGWPAKNNMLQYPQSIIFDSKRLIGLKYNNPSIQNDIKNLPLKIIEDKETGKPQYLIKIENEEKKYFPEDVSSMILKYIKNYAEMYENKEIKKAVITVPAHFNNLQREATIKAAEDAGL